MQILNANTFVCCHGTRNTEVATAQLDDKLLFSYCNGTNVFVTFNEFIMKFAQSIPPFTLQRKKQAVIQPHEE